MVEGQHEPLIDRMSFDIVQNKLKSRQRPGQTNATAGNLSVHPPISG